MRFAMDEAPTTVIIQKYLDANPEDTAAEPIVRELLERAVGRLRMLCARFLYKSYPRLTRPPVNLETDELLGGVMARLLPDDRASNQLGAPAAGHSRHRPDGRQSPRVARRGTRLPPGARSVPAQPLPVGAYVHP
jgi:hypothetical protein